MPLLGWANNLFHDSSLTADRSDLRSEVGKFLGFGFSESEWSSDNSQIVNYIVEAGQRQFYFPPPLPGRTVAHKWSFLRPTATLVTVSGTDDYEMPTDFAGIDGEFTYATSEGYVPIPVIGEWQIRDRRQYSTSNGKPRLAAIRPKATSGTVGQRFEVLLWPCPDAVYNLTYRYVSLPDKMTDTNRFPLGNVPHGETLLASCLAIAEERYNDVSGVQRRYFMERLAASVAFDTQNTAPERLGYNGNPRSTPWGRKYDTPYTRIHNNYVTLADGSM